MHADKPTALGQIESYCPAKPARRTGYQCGPVGSVYGHVVLCGKGGDSKSQVFRNGETAL